MSEQQPSSSPVDSGPNSQIEQILPVPTSLFLNLLDQIKNLEATVVRLQQQNPSDLTLVNSRIINEELEFTTISCLETAKTAADDVLEDIVKSLGEIHLSKDVRKCLLPISLTCLFNLQVAKTSRSASKFRCYTKLPQELRDKIWDIALAVPQVV
jgi:hypothetical protein